MGWTDNFKKSFSSDRYPYILLLEVALIVVLVTGGYVMRAGVQDSMQGIETLKNQLEAIGGMTSSYAMQLRDETTTDVFGKIFVYSIIFAIFAIAAWSFFKYLIYNRMLGLKFSKQIFWRFAVMTILWGFVSFMLFILVQNLAFTALQNNLETSYVARLLAFASFTVTFLVLYWLTINLFSHLVKSGTLKGAVVGLWQNGMMEFAWPEMIVAIVMFIVLNIVMLLYMMIGPYQGFLWVFSILLLFYMTWVRVYFTQRVDISEKQSARRHEQGHGHRVHAVTRQKSLPKK